MAALPGYLRSCLIADDIDENSLTAAGTLCCNCGSTNVEMLFPGATMETDGKLHPCDIETDDGDFFIIKAKCARCSRTFLLFDRDYHGWDGFHCHNHDQAMLPRPQLVPWHCVKCGNLQHSVSIRVDHVDPGAYADSQQRMNESFDEEGWLLSFEWIFMTITCCTCGLTSKNWVDYETA